MNTVECGGSVGKSKEKIWNTFAWRVASVDRRFFALESRVLGPSPTRIKEKNRGRRQNRRGINCVQVFPLIFSVSSSIL